MMIPRKISLLISLLLPIALCAQNRRLSVSGTIRDQRSGETLTGATISFPGHPGLGVTTNAYGFYSITLPEGQYSMVITFSGYEPDTVALDLKQNLIQNRTLSNGKSQLQKGG